MSLRSAGDDVVSRIARLLELEGGGVAIADAVEEERLAPVGTVAHHDDGLRRQRLVGALVEPELLPCLLYTSPSPRD